MSAGRSSNMLKRFAALLVPARPGLDRVGGRVEQLVEALLLVGAKRVRTWSTALRSGSPIPTRSRLNFSVPSSSMIEPRPL